MIYNENIYQVQSKIKGNNVHKNRTTTNKKNIKKHKYILNVQTIGYWQITEIIPISFLSWEE